MAQSILILSIYILLSYLCGDKNLEQRVSELVVFQVDCIRECAWGDTAGKSVNVPTNKLFACEKREKSM